MATAADHSRHAGPPNLLCVGFFRTGTASLGAALSQIGYTHVFHGLNSVDKPSHWSFIERAAHAKWPHILTPRSEKRVPPFTRRDWDELFGPFDALTDFSCLFAPELIAAYPDAKVILTERDSDRWMASFESTVLACMFSPGASLLYKTLGIICNHRAGHAMQKALTGYFGGATTMAQFRNVSKRAYLDHYEEIKALVPKERLLVYRVGKDGWEPLCRFLERPVPEGPFPFVNEGQAYDQLLRGVYRRYCWKALRIMLPWVIVAMVVMLFVMWAWV